MALNEYPVLFGETEIPFANKWSERYEVVEEVNKSESGTDIIQVTRYDKLSVSASYKCTSTWAKTFKQFSQGGVISVSIYDQIEEDYVVRNMRMRNFSLDFVRKSQDVEISNGLWEVSFDLLEI